jgi:drug/metabolite transporter (DMT)-like permease
MNPHRLRAYIYLIIVAAIWGAAGPVIKFTLSGIPPLPFLAYRFAISAIFSLLFFLKKGVRLPKPKSSLPQIVTYAILGFTVALGALFVGLEKTTVLDLALIAIIGPLIVALGGAFFFRDRITSQERLGIAIVLLGAFIYSFAPILTSGANIRLTGNLFILISLLADAAATLVAKRLLQKNIPPSTITNTGFIVGAATIIPLAVTVHGKDILINSVVNLPFKYHLGVWYMALLSGTLAYFLSVRGQKSIEVSEASLFQYLQPIFSVPLAVFWLGEKITIPFIIGAGFIAIGVIIAEYKKKR